MTDRREFKRAIKVAIAKRSMIDGVPTCEDVDEKGVRCLCQKGLECHHDDMDAMLIDKSKPLTVDDGRMLCAAHHDPITKKQVGVLSKVKRMEAAHLGAEKPNKAEIKSDPHALKSRRRPTHEGRESLPPRAMFVSLGDIASDVLAKLNPKEAAE
jgi:hypothetical protein